MKSNVVLVKFLIILALAYSEDDQDLYKILGINKRATQKEIKQAYKNLAKEWYVIIWKVDSVILLMFCNLLVTFHVRLLWYCDDWQTMRISPTRPFAEIAIWRHAIS